MEGRDFRHGEEDAGSFIIGILDYGNTRSSPNITAFPDSILMVLPTAEGLKYGILPENHCF
jgi:hypothetical protein